MIRDDHPMLSDMFQNHHSMSLKSAQLNLFDKIILCFPSIVIAFAVFSCSYISPENLQSYPDRNYSFTLVSFLPIAFFLAISGFIFKFSFNRFNLYAHYQKAYSWYKSNDLNNAEGEYAKALPGMKNDPVFLLDYSICLIANNKQTEAIHYLLLAEKTDNDPRIYMLIGDIYKLWKNYSKAEEYYKKSILIIPSRIFPKYCSKPITDSRIQTNVTHWENVSTASVEWLTLKLFLMIK
jgi:tetratricopeptide (TPR) repeat protein